MKVGLCFPVFNESEMITEYLNELEIAFRDIPRTYFITDDCSTDDTYQKLLYQRDRLRHLNLQRNNQNQGHGISIGSSVNRALEAGCTHILTFDGDGQASGSELFRFFMKAIEQNYGYAEAVRVQRVDPWFRKLISLLTRFLVLFSSKSFPKDANTPVRFYDREIALNTWGLIYGNRIIIPNIYISSIARRRKLMVNQIEILWRLRLGHEKSGTTWGKSRWQFLPSRRLYKFCTNAIVQWIRIPPR